MKCTKGDLIRRLFIFHRHRSEILNLMLDRFSKSNPTINDPFYEGLNCPDDSRFQKVFSCFCMDHNLYEFSHENMFYSFGKSQ